jgi:hypothetical protein
MRANITGISNKMNGFEFVISFFIVCDLFLSGNEAIKSRVVLILFGWLIDGFIVVTFDDTNKHQRFNLLKRIRPTDRICR